MRGFHPFGTLEPGTFFHANEIEWVKLPDIVSDGKTLNALVSADVPAQSIDAVIRTSFFGVRALVLADPEAPKAEWLQKALTQTRDQ